MLRAFYESLETLKTVKLPRRQEVINLTIITFVVTLIVWVYLLGADTLRKNVYQAFYNLMSSRVWL